MRLVKRILLLLLVLSALRCKDNTVSPVDLLDDPSVKPMVVYTFPGANSAGPFDNFGTAITVRFNKLMDQASVQHAVSFNSPAGDLRPDTGRASSSTGDVYSITPVVANINIPFQWRVNQTYQLTIGPTAVDVNGNDLGTPFILVFTPEPYFRVKTISPANGQANVSTSTIRLGLNAPVDTSFFSNISISPPLSGRWRYQSQSSFGIDSSQILFQLSKSYPAGTSYNLTIGGNAHDKNGDPLVGGFSSSFSAIPFGITSTNPTAASANVSLFMRTIYAFCTDTLDTASVRRAFRIIPDIPGSFDFSGDQRTILFDLAASLVPQTTYTIRIDTSLRSTSGMQLPQPYAVSFTTANFGVAATYPSNGDTSVYARTQLEVVFNGDIDSGSVRGAFSINPPINGLFDFTASTNVFYFSPITDWTPGTTYTVTISTNLLSISGGHLPAAYTFWFTVAPFSVSSVYPSDGSTHIQRATNINVYTTDLIDTSTIRGSFNISPPAPGYLSFSNTSAYFQFIPDTILQQVTVYTVTVGATLKSINGGSLRSPYSFSFATGE